MDCFGPVRWIPLAEKSVGHSSAISREDQTTMPALQQPAFDPHDVPESNATAYPELFRAANLYRYNRRLGNHAGLQNYGSY
jgi:hypothetical protein